MKDKIKENKKNIIAGIIFLISALFMATVVPTIQVAWVMGLLILTIYLFAFEILDVDVTAISIMVLLGLSTLFAPIMGLDAGLVSTDKLFNGFSSNAVMSIIAVMIIGAGLDKTGIMTKVASFILNVGGTSEKRIIPIVSSTVGFISSFMQNVGAAALFIPVVSRISARSGLPMSRLLMPMGFCAILGGTVTMVGSSPLILLNDLILTSNHALPEAQQMQTWGLFSVTPVGLALVFTGILYFVIAGRFVLPKVSSKPDANTATNTMDYFQNIYGIDYALFEVVVPAGSPLVGHVLNDIEEDEHIRIIAAIKGNTKSVTIGPNGVARDYTIEANTVLGILGSEQLIKDFVQDYTLNLKTDLEFFSDTLSSSRSGVAEVVIPPGSQLIDKSARDIWLRKTYGLAMVALHREGETLGTGEGIRDLPFQAGDTLVVHTLWNNLDRITKDKNFVVVTTEYPHDESRPKKVGWAGLFFAIALSLVLFTDLKLS
ncbi:MAG: SLC13 family permease, partial [Pseudomonadota bacterium]